MCKKPWPHTFKDNRFNTDGTGRLHGWIQTHLDLTVTLYITSLPTTLNWALTHSHLFHPMQTSQNTEESPVPRPHPRPNPIFPAHDSGYTCNKFSSTQRNVQKTPQYTVCIDTISPSGNNLINKMYRPATEMLNSKYGIKLWSKVMTKGFSPPKKYCTTNTKRWIFSLTCSFLFF